MSDESSLGSPRMKTPDLKAKPRGQMPWWAEEEDDDDRKKTEAVRQSWLKPKTSKLGEGKPELETTNNVWWKWNILFLAVFFVVYKAQSTFHSNFLLFITAKPNLQTCLCKFYTINKCPALLATRYWSTCSSMMVLRQKRQHKMLLDSKDSHVLLTIIKIYLK